MKSLLSLSVLLNVLLIVGLLLLVQSLGGFRYMWFKMQHRGAAGVYEHRKQLFELLPQQDSTIVFLGNSITAQCEWSELFQNPHILNRGIPGDFTTGVLERLPSISKLQAQKLFLMIGVNDLVSSDAQQVLSNYRKILSKIQQQSPTTTVYIQSVLPVNDMVRKTSVDNAAILEVNAGLQKLAQKFQLEYIDLHALLKDKKGRLDAQYTYDGIHLNGKAYLIWKSRLAPILN